jgi:hypothetical protein
MGYAGAIMRKLTLGLKRTLSALAARDAVDHPNGPDNPEAAGPSPKNAAEAARTDGRVALVSDGRARGAALDYAVEACRRQGASLDLLVQGQGTHGLEIRLRRAGVAYRRIRLTGDPARQIAEYARNHPGLSYIVGIAADDASRRLLEGVTRHGRGRLPVPLVLIEDRPTRRPPATAGP